ENDVVQRVEARLEELAMRLDPLGLGFQPGLSQSAGPHASHLLCADEPGLLQDADVLLHAGQRHLELLGEARDRRFSLSKLLDHAAAGKGGKRRERKIEIRSRILNHMVQYNANVRASARARSKGRGPSIFPAVCFCVPKQPWPAITSADSATCSEGPHARGAIGRFWANSAIPQTRSHRWPAPH